MILGFLRSFALFLLRVPMILLGLPVVWVALPYATLVSTMAPFTQYPERGSWGLIRLPTWALWWDNAFDGMLGDKRGWWANECDGQHSSQRNKWRWAALRNPANYFSRNVCGVDVSNLTIELVKGTAFENYRGYELLRGTDSNGRIYPRFYLEYAFTATHGLMIDFGYKVKLSHNGTPSDAPEKDRLKGIVMVASPWKELS